MSGTNCNDKTVTVNNTITVSCCDDSNTINFGEWQPYTPIVTPSVGSFTNVTATGSYQTIGRTVVFQIIVDMLTVGPASGSLIATLPFKTAPGTAFVIPGRENNITGKMCQGYVGGFDDHLVINYYDNSSVLASGNRFLISGVYESSSNP